MVGDSGTDSVTLQGYSNSVTRNGGTDTVTGGAGDESFDLTGGSASLALSGDSYVAFPHNTNATTVIARSEATEAIAESGRFVRRSAGIASSASLQ